MYVPHLKRITWIGFLAGLSVFVLLVGYYGIAAIAAGVAVAGMGGLALIAAAHILPLAAEAIGWRFLFEPAQRPRCRTLLWARWIGESVDTLLPVAQVGGDLVRIRLFTRLGMSGTMVAATLVADRTLTVAALIGFTLVGLILLVSLVTADGIALPVLLAALVGMLLLGGFYVAQQRGLFGALARMFQTFGGSLNAKVVNSANALDQEIRAVYARRKDVLLSAFWLSAAWIFGVVEVWLALWLLGYPVNLLAALLIESLVQGIRAAAFLIPGALGAQEGGFLIVGTLVGVPADAALALALTRRVRELAFGVPGILAWQWFEACSQRLKQRRGQAEARRQTLAGRALVTAPWRRGW